MVSIKTATAFLTASLILAGAASAQTASKDQHAPQTMSGMGEMKKGSDLSGLTMAQQMARCAEMREQMKANKPMSADMQQIMKQCDAMDRQMEMPSGTKSR